MKITPTSYPSSFIQELIFLLSSGQVTQSFETYFLLQVMAKGDVGEDGGELLGSAEPGCNLKNYCHNGICNTTSNGIYIYSGICVSNGIFICNVSGICVWNGIYIYSSTMLVAMLSPFASVYKLQNLEIYMHNILSFFFYIIFLKIFFCLQFCIPPCLTKGSCQDLCWRRQEVSFWLEL